MITTSKNALLQAYERKRKSAILIYCTSQRCETKNKAMHSAHSYVLLLLLWAFSVVLYRCLYLCLYGNQAFHSNSICNNVLIGIWLKDLYVHIRTITFQPLARFWNLRYDFVNLYYLVDGNWGKWSEWSTCTKTCKQGKQSRTRECNSPAPRYGGKACVGKRGETRVCNDNVPCPGKLYFNKNYYNYPSEGLFLCLVSFITRINNIWMLIYRFRPA